MALGTFGKQLTSTYVKIIDSTPSRLTTMEFINTSNGVMYIYLGTDIPTSDNHSIRIGAGTSWYSQRRVDSDVWARCPNDGDWMQVVSDGEV